ncbi:hypothetical protein [Aureimonas psammosilenae]|uniref:hypothetical protein n=1 Tax=Aureimonas psammosilenae TaxID=2495496 RepID=UPI00126111D4|nr:hypothetical protein [Aureimonas psammosilenae]
MGKRAGALCASLLIVTPPQWAMAQSVEDFLPDFRPEEGRGFERRVGELLRSMPEGDPSRPFPLSVEIGGARIAPDFKRRGLKVIIPVEALHLSIGAPDDSEVEPETF